MPGGQDPRAHQRGPLTERLGLNRVPPRAEAGRGQVPRHCWVVDCPEVQGSRAGLLLEWRQTDQGWAARVAVVLDGINGPAVLTLWVRSEHLRPAG